IEDAIDVIQLLAKKGVFVGPSSGAYVSAALKVAETRKYKTIVTLLNDTGERYTSTGVWRAQESSVRAGE
ncbi:MAG: hypothetical protein L6Q71_06245, partial [Planctomycetes bacterium]|nr:hypothetical protein [Planctomycetota bacterium]